MATINGVEVIGDKSAHDFDLLDKDDGINLANGVERNRKATEDNHEDIVLHRTDRDVHVTPEWKNSLVTKEILGLYWTAAQTADIINEISIAGGAKLVKVDALPAVGLEQTIYLVPKTDPQAGDVFDEFVWVDGKYEFIGTTKANLSNYYTKVETDYLFSQLDFKYVKSDDTTIVKLTNENEINLQEDHYNAWLGYRGGKVTNWKFGDGTEGGYANIYAKDFYLNDEKLSDLLNGKAIDSDTVHKSGNETIGGVKTFRGDIAGSGALLLRSNSGTSKIYIRDTDAPNYPSSVNLFSKVGDNPEYGVFLNGNHFHPNLSGEISLGLTNRVWKNVYTNAINGINPGALSLPKVSDDVVTVDTTTFQWNTNWNYTPVFDGWLSVWVPASSATKRRYSASQEYLRFWYPNQNGEIFRFTMPVVKGVPVGFGFISDIEEPVAPAIYLMKAQGNV